MSRKDIDYYGPADKAIKALNRQIVEDFGRLKMAKWDDVKVLQTVLTVYRECVKKARKRYYEVGFEAYLLALSLCETDAKEAHKMAEKAITEEWVNDIMEQTDFITLYRFTTEAERKADRLAEAMEIAPNRNMEIDRAMRYWSQQVGQYALNVTDYAVLQAYEDAGVEYAQWQSEKDDRVCQRCHEYDGQVFRLEDLPGKPHYQCRCRFLPVQDMDERD